MGDKLTGKARELSIVEGFLTRLSATSPTIDPGERPDFVAMLGPRGVRVGIELTELQADQQRQGGSAEREAHDLWRRFSAELSRRLVTDPDAIPHACGVIGFRDPDWFTDCRSKAARERLRDDMARLVREASLNDALTRVSSFDPSRFPALAAEVDWVSMRLASEHRGPRWRAAHAQSGAVQGMSDAIRAAVAAKAGKSLGYAWKDVAERWLLLYPSGDGLSDLAAVVDDPGIADTGEFTHVFLWDKFSETITQLAPSFAAVLESGSALHTRNVPPSARAASSSA
jgi:hypothetical protein